LEIVIGIARMAEDKLQMVLDVVMTIEGRLVHVEEQVEDLQTRLQALEADVQSAGIGEGGQKKQEDLQKVQQAVRDVREVVVRSSNHLAQLEKQVEIVKTGSTSSMLVSIVFVSILFILSLLMRA
jgi:hypothetical protein